MPFFNWTSDMSVGLIKLDDDHKVLISIINRIADSLENDLDESVMLQSFTALLRYTEIHFGREEAVLSAVNFPEFTPHHKNHKSFIQDIIEMQKDFEVASTKEMRENVLDYLKGWLINHIMIEDMAYKPFIAENPKAVKASETFSSIGIWARR